MLEAAARELAESAKFVGIVTGFCVADADPPTAETDGPPGALFLARTLRALGQEVVLLSDRYTLPMLDLGRRLWGLDVELFEIPLSPDGERWIDSFFRSSLGSRLTHLISIERVGPSHTIESLNKQHRSCPSPVDRFLVEVPEDHRGVCHNMRGVAIDDYTAHAHRLFEVDAPTERRIPTIGIGDGGNEIGMGAVSWELLREALNREHAGRIICRVPTDFLILSGVSNWGAYALACATAALNGRSQLIANWSAERQRELIESLVRDAGAIDGLTRLHEPTVDGLPLNSYLDVLQEIRAGTTAQ